LPRASQARIVAPLIRITDLRREVGELRLRAGLGGGLHPGQLVDPASHGRDDVFHQLVGGGLRLRRKVPLDVDLADVVRESICREGHAALPPLFLLRCSGKGRAVESEDGIVDLLGQDGAVAAQRANQQLVFQHLQRCRLDRLGDAGEGARLIDDQLITLGADPIEIGTEVEARRAALELGDRHLVVGLGRIAAFDLGPVRPRDLRFKVKDGLGPGGSVGLARKRQHFREEF